MCGGTIYLATPGRPMFFIFKHQLMYYSKLKTCAVINKLGLDPIQVGTFVVWYCGVSDWSRWECTLLSIVVVGFVKPFFRATLTFELI